MRILLVILTVLCGPVLSCAEASVSRSDSASGDSERFVGFDDAAIAKLASADSVARKLSKGPSLGALLAAVPKASWDHRSDAAELREDTGDVIYRNVMAAFPAETDFAGYSAWPWWSKTIATDNRGNAIRINRRKIDMFSVDDYVGTIWHEVAHKAHYFHDGNARKGNECTVPHLIGDAATAVSKKVVTGAWGTLPSDACDGLRIALRMQPP